MASSACSRNSSRMIGEAQGEDRAAHPLDRAEGDQRADVPGENGPDRTPTRKTARLITIRRTLPCWVAEAADRRGDGRPVSRYAVTVHVTQVPLVFSPSWSLGSAGIGRSA